MKYCIRFYSSLFIRLAFLICLPLGVMAQDEEKASAEPELISPSLDLVAVQQADKSISLRVSMKAKIKGVFYNLHTLKVKFLQVTDTAEKELGQLITNAQGKGVLQVAGDKIGNEGTITLKAVYAGNKKMEPAEAEVTIKRAYIQLTPVKEDSLLTVKASVVVPGSEGDSSVKELTLGLYVKRMINPLKLTEATTDENGEATLEVPANLPGDDKGNLTLLVKLDEHESFGNLEAAVVQPWGTKVSSVPEEQPRALWSSHPPLWMLITFILLMGVVWGHYIVIVYQLFRLRKEEPPVPA